MIAHGMNIIFVFLLFVGDCTVIIAEFSLPGQTESL